MQVIIHIMVNPSEQEESLRKKIITDLSENGHGLEVGRQKKRGRQKGWADITAKDCHGALKISWDNSSKTLTARAITKGGNRPDLLMALFIRYLICERAQEIGTIVIRTL